MRIDQINDILQRDGVFLPSIIKKKLKHLAQLHQLRKQKETEIENDKILLDRAQDKFIETLVEDLSVIELGLLDIDNILDNIEKGFETTIHEEASISPFANMIYTNKISTFTESVHDFKKIYKQNLSRFFVEQKNLQRKPNKHHLVDTLFNRQMITNIEILLDSKYENLEKQCQQYLGEIENWDSMRALGSYLKENGFIYDDSLKKLNIFLEKIEILKDLNLYIKKILQFLFGGVKDMKKFKNNEELFEKFLDAFLDDNSIFGTLDEIKKVAPVFPNMVKSFSFIYNKVY